MRYKKRNNNRADSWLGELHVLVLPKMVPSYNKWNL